MAKATDTKMQTTTPAAEVVSEDQNLVVVDPNLVTSLEQLSDIEPELARPKGIDPSNRDGLEDINMAEVRLPRLAIAQGLSPQMVPSEGQYIKGLSLFEMFNDITGDIYGNGPLTVVPVRRHVTRIEFDPNDKKVPLDREVPANDPRMQWTASIPGGKKDTPPRATEFVEYVCILLRRGFAPEPVVVSIKTTNKYMKRAAELWKTYIGIKGVAIYRGMYHITSKSEKGKTKDGQDTNYGVFVVKNAGFVPDKTAAGQMLLELAKNLHDSLEGKIIDVNREGTMEDDATSFDTTAMDGQTVSEPSGQTDM